MIKQSFTKQLTQAVASKQMAQKELDTIKAALKRAKRLASQKGQQKLACIKHKEEIQQLKRELDRSVKFRIDFTAQFEVFPFFYF